MIVCLTKRQISTFLLPNFLYRAIYNVFFHPLHGFPGPKAAAATPLLFAWRLCNGRLTDWVISLHEKYGEVVRIHPNELSFVGDAAWQDIFRCRPELPRPVAGPIAFPNGVLPLPTIVGTENHTRQKRILNHGFSDRALKEQEHILQKRSDASIDCLADQIGKSNNSPDIDICNWYYCTTFDIISEFCFSEDFRSLEDAETHPWLAGVFEGMKMGKIMTAFDHFPPLGPLVARCARYAARDRLRRIFSWSQEKIDRRIAQKSERPDLLKFVLENNDKQGMTRDEIDSTITVILLTGSGDTLVAAMAALTYFALQNPMVMERLQEEIKSAVGKNPENITVAMVSKLEYLDAALQEAMRMHAPAPGSNPRVVNRPGIQVCGIPIPQGTQVGIPHKTAYRHRSNFVEPETFLPERWLEDPDGRFAADRKAVFEPFSVGQRSCIGKTLALAEMKLILVKVLWHFDLVLSERNEGDWCDQKSYMAHEKKPLYVKLQLSKLGMDRGVGKESDA